MCGWECGPWVPKSNFTHPNKRVVISPNGDEKLAKLLNMDPNGHEFFFARWPDTSTSQLAHRPAPPLARWNVNGDLE